MSSTQRSYLLPLSLRASAHGTRPWTSLKPLRFGIRHHFIKISTILLLFVFLRSLLGSGICLRRYTHAVLNHSYGASDFGQEESSTTSQTNEPFERPEYTEFYEQEALLPQHNPDLPYPEGRNGRYVLFSSSRVNLVGWNNKLNDMLLNNILAHASNRAYVFHDFAWAPEHYPGSIPPATPGSPSSSEDPLELWARAPHTPLSALISGPSAGAPWQEHDPAPRSVSLDYFNDVCPKERRRLVYVGDIKAEPGSSSDADGKTILDRWIRLLGEEITEECVEILAGFSPGSTRSQQSKALDKQVLPEIFDIDFWSGPRSLSIWDEFVTSPVSRLLGASSLVREAIERSLHLFRRDDEGGPDSYSHKGDSTRNSESFSSVLSIHVRRGDFEQACMEHALANDTFYNWNLLPFLPDRFDYSDQNRDNESLYDEILQRCWPSMHAIREKVRRTRKEWAERNPRTSTRNLTTLYIMSNDKTPFLSTLRDAFLNEDGWERVLTSRDLKDHLDDREREVSVAVDMEIGRRSAVFIGNGWSSFTSNVVHRRLVDTNVDGSTRFW